MDHAAPPANAPVSRRRRALLLAGLLILAATAALSVDVARQRSYTEAVAWAGPTALATPAKRPALVRFTADWCPPCRVMKRDVFSRADIAADLGRRYRAVSVDLTDPTPEARDLALRHAVQSIPTFVVLTADGREAGRLVGGAGTARFNAFLDRHAAP